jgi:hypothetical protein
MAVRLYQSTTNSSNATVSIATTYAKPINPGNLLICIVTCDATVNMSSAGWTLAASGIASGATYLWYKLALPGESSSVTVAPTGSAPTSVGILEFESDTGWFNPQLDQKASNTTAGSATTLATGTTPATTSPNEFSIAVLGPHGWTVVGTPPTGISWTNSFTNILTTPNTSSASAGINVMNFIATSTLTSKGTKTTTATWTNASTASQAVIATFFIGFADKKKSTLRPHIFSPGIAR